MSFQTSALLLSWVAILLLSLVVAGLVRQVHALSQGAPRPAGLGPAPGSRAPEFDRLGSGLLLFLDRDCGACAEVLARAPSLGGRVTAIFAGPAAETSLPVLAGESSLFAAYGIPATPFAVVVDGAGRVRAAEPVGSAAALDDLRDQWRDQLDPSDLHEPPRPPEPPEPPEPHEPHGMYDLPDPAEVRKS